MLIQIIIALGIGIIFGTLTGLIPGIHINLVGIILVSSSISFLTSINPIYLIVFITAMAITHTFIDFIPSIFLGCPDTDTELSILPGHELLKKGHGYKAIILTAYGGLAAILVLILISFPITLIMKKIYIFLLQSYSIPIILFLVSLSLIFLEKKKFMALFVFSISGILGTITLNIPELNQPLLPLLTGLFGSSMLILSIKNKTKIPPQKKEVPKNISKPFASAFLGSLIAAPLCSFLPGLGSGQAALIGNTISKNNREGFLILLGITNTLVMGFSFLSLYAISKTRTGAAAAIKEIIGNLSTELIILIIIIILLSGIISFFLTKLLAKFFSGKVMGIDYSILSYVTLAILVIVVFLASNFLGLLILIISTLTGIYVISQNVRRTQMMGCLLIPTIILYLT